MVNAIEDMTGQKIVLEVLQLLAEYEFIIKILSGLKGQESPVELLKGLSEQPEQIQVEFLRWVSRTAAYAVTSLRSIQFSSMAGTSNGRTMLIGIQDEFAPIFTDSIHNETTSNRAKYEIAVVLHNLLCINTDSRVWLSLPHVSPV